MSGQGRGKAKIGLLGWLGDGVDAVGQKVSEWAGSPAMTSFAQGLANGMAGWSAPAPPPRQQPAPRQRLAAPLKSGGSRVVTVPIERSSARRSPPGRYPQATFMGVAGDAQVLPFGGQVGAGLVMDSKGDIRFYGSYGGGLGVPTLGASAGPVVGGLNGYAEDMAGVFGNVSLGGAYAGGADVDVFGGKSSDGTRDVIGTSFSPQVGGGVHNWAGLTNTLLSPSISLLDLMPGSLGDASRSTLLKRWMDQ